MIRGEIISRKYLVILMVNLAIVFLTCNLMLNVHFSPDTYDIWTTTDNNVDVHLRDGRFITAAIYQILADISINVAKTQAVFTLIFMIGIALLTTILVNRAERYFTKKDIVRLGIVDISFLLLFHNGFIAEWYLFPEVMLMYTFSVIGIVVSSLSFVRTCESSNIQSKVKFGIISFGALLIALGTYQVSIGIYIALILIFIFLNSNISITKKLQNAAFGLTFGAVQCFLNVGIVKMLTYLHIMEPTPRGANLQINVILENMQKILGQQGEIISGHHIFPPITFAFYGLLLLVILISNCKGKQNLQALSLALLFAGIIYAGSYIPHIVTSDFWLSQRTLVPIFGVFSFLAIVCTINSNKQMVTGLLAIAMSSFMLCNSVLMENVFSDHLAMDDFDISYAKAIHTYISEYSEKHDLNVRYLAIGRDSNPTWSYDGIRFVSYDINVKNILRSWSNIGLINTANGTDYQACDIDPLIWNKYFEGKDWNHFCPEEQIRVLNDTAYVAIY